MKILVTGGAGYIGSHVVRTLGEAGHDLVIYDNLSTGHEWAILSGLLVHGDLADKRFTAETLKAFGPEAVIHFAASIQVEESVREPLAYYRNNVINTLNLLDAMRQSGVRRLIYSSTAAVYGIPAKNPVVEETPLAGCDTGEDANAQTHQHHSPDSSRRESNSFLHASPSLPCSCSCS